MYGVFCKIEKWWILEIEIPISGDFPNLTEEEANGAMSGYMVVLDAIIDILANDSNKNFKEVFLKVRCSCFITRLSLTLHYEEVFH